MTSKIRVLINTTKPTYFQLPDLKPEMEIRIATASGSFLTTTLSALGSSPYVQYWAEIARRQEEERIRKLMEEGTGT